MRKALLYLEEQRLVTRAHVKEKDKDREARTRQRALENGVDEGIIAERVANIERKTVTYVCLNYSRIVDALTLRIGKARADLKHRVERGPISVLFRCTSDPEVCGKRYSSLDAARLLDPATMQFVCQVCKGEVVQLGGGEDGAPPEPRTREGMKAIWDKFERQMAPVQKQLDRVRGIVPPQYGTLNEWTRARRKAAERAANGGGGGGGGGGGRSGGLSVQLDVLEETKFEVTLGLTEEQEAAMEAEANAPKAQPEWVTRNQFEALDRAAGDAATTGEGNGAGDDAAAAAAKRRRRRKKKSGGVVARVSRRAQGSTRLARRRAKAASVRRRRRRRRRSRPPLSRPTISWRRRWRWRAAAASGRTSTTIGKTRDFDREERDPDRASPPLGRIPRHHINARVYFVRVASRSRARRRRRTRRRPRRKRRRNRRRRWTRRRRRPEPPPEAPACAAAAPACDA